MIERSPLLLTLSDLERLQSIFKTFWYRDTDQTALELAALLEPLALKTSRGAPPSLKTLEMWIKKRGADPFTSENKTTPKDKGLDSLDRWIIIMKLRGLSYRKIGERLSLSHTGARKRLDKIKKLPSEKLPPVLSVKPSKGDEHENTPPVLLVKALSASEGDERLAQLCFAWWAYRPAIQRDPQAAFKLISERLTRELDAACGHALTSNPSADES
jgi:hypothetical protein